MPLTVAPTRAEVASAEIFYAVRARQLEVSSGAQPCFRRSRVAAWTRRGGELGHHHHFEGANHA
jgi:hypothetical protein